MNVTYVKEGGEAATREALRCAACSVIPMVCFFLTARALEIAEDGALCQDCLDDLLEFARSYHPDATRQSIRPSVVRRWLRLVGATLEGL